MRFTTHALEFSQSKAQLGYDAFRTKTVNVYSYDSLNKLTQLYTFLCINFINMSFITNSTLTHGSKKYFSENTL